MFVQAIVRIFMQNVNVSEDACIITSLNLYEFSQINNNEMGILLKRSEDGEAIKMLIAKRSVLSVLAMKLRFQSTS